LAAARADGVQRTKRNRHSRRCTPAQRSLPPRGTTPRPPPSQAPHRETPGQTARTGNQSQDRPPRKPDINAYKARKQTGHSENRSFR
jgi:hypothetical protein